MDVCLECYPNPPRFWRDGPMNEEIRNNLTWQRHANLYYFTLDEALTVWGEQIEEKYHVSNQTG
jgi:hypothetical protein